MLCKEKDKVPQQIQRNHQVIEQIKALGKK